MQVCFLEQDQADVPNGDAWLSIGEAARLQKLKVPKRRADWRLGRWTAKRAVALYLHRALDVRSLAEIEVSALPSGAPCALLAGKPVSVAISLSHSAGKAICAITHSHAVLGCDLEQIEPRSSAFVADYLTAEEQLRVSQASDAERDLLVTLFWSAKESTLKALGVGLRADTRSATVSLADPALPSAHEHWEPQPIALAGVQPARWDRLLVRTSGGEELHGWWTRQDHAVETFIAGPGVPGIPNS